MTTPSPLVTIATVCRNPGKSLECTLQSVREQNGVAWEHVVIDGASTDGTRERLEALDTSRHSFISEPDGGIYDAMNKAVQMARGDWILFLNAGDMFIGPDSLFLLTRHAKNDVDHVAGNLFFKWPNGRMVRMAPHGLTRPPLLMPVLHPATLSRRQRLMTTPFDISYRIAGDMDFFLHEMTNGARFLFIPEAISIFALDGVSTKRRWRTHMESRRAILAHTHFPMWRRAVLECRLLARYLAMPVFMALRRARSMREDRVALVLSHK